MPVEIYCFTNITNWPECEMVKAEILDHIYSILPEFGLEIFQKPSGFDSRLTSNKNPEESDS